LQILHLQSPVRAGLTLSQVVATVTQGIDDAAMDWEPEIEETADNIDTVDLARFAQSRNPVQDQAPRAEDVADAPKDTPAQPILADEVLRSLVRDLVREQFQGDLGVQITRSIRKLVKTEVAREMDLRSKD